MEDDLRSSVTQLLNDTGLDGRERARQLLPLLYDEMRRLARQRMAGERPGHTLQATALVHEAYMRLVGDTRSSWQDRAHFFAAASEAMRRILVDQARRRLAAKRGGDRQRVELDGIQIEAGTRDGEPTVDPLAIDRAISVLEAEHDRKATLVKLRYYAGLTLDEAAAALDISPATADRDWAFAKAFLYAELRRSTSVE